jgi:type IV pilus assembly protein PilW
VEGIENMQIVYGEDMSGDRIPDRYVKADTVANWRNVMAVRIGILARSLAQTESGGKEYGPDVDTGSYDVDGDGTNDFTVPAPGDRYQRRVFRTTVLMRNLQ